MTTFVKGYFGRKPYPYHTRETIQAAADALRRKEREWNEFVGNVLAMELDHVLSAEPLDSDQFNDLTEDEKARMREAG